jgi:hypothetical protein
MASKSRGTAKDLLKAFRSLPKTERDAVLIGIAGDRALRRDLLDLAAFAQRKREPSRPLRDYLAERRQK